MRLVKKVEKNNGVLIMYKLGKACRIRLKNILPGDILHAFARGSEENV